MDDFEWWKMELPGKKKKKIDEIKFYVPVRGMIEAKDSGNGTYISWQDYQALLKQVIKLCYQVMQFRSLQVE